MRISPYLILLLFFPLIGYTQDINVLQTGWEGMDLKGKVRSIEQILYQPKNGSSEDWSDEQIVNGWYVGEYPKVIKFNRSGYITNITEYEVLSKKKKYSEKKITYNPQNEIDSISECIWGCDAKYFYSIQVVSKSDTIIQNKILHKIVFYTPNGRISTKFPTKKYPHGQLLQKSYFNKGKLIKRVRYRKDSTIQEKILFDYNDDGKRETRKNLAYKNTRHNGQKKLDDFFSTITTYHYNDKGLLKEKDEFNLKNDSLKKKTLYKYDKHGNKIEIKSNDAGITDSHRRDPVIIQKDSGFNPDGSVKYSQKYNYKYDKKGNWIERQEVKNDIIEYVTKRKIEYYKP